MNIIEVTRKVLNEFQGIGAFANPESIHIDYTEAVPESYGLSSTGDVLVREDILGNQIRQHNFIMYSVNHSYNDYSRLANSSFLLNLGYYLEYIMGEEFEVSISKNGTLLPSENLQPSENMFPPKSEIKKKATLKKITPANAMMFEILDGDMNNGVRYQLQLTVEYRVESEGI